MRTLLRFAALAALFGALAQAQIIGARHRPVMAAAAGCASGYAHCKQLTLGTISGTLTDLVVLVDFTASGTRAMGALGASKINNASCYDVAFSSDQAGTTPLYWELVGAACNSSTGAVAAWVKIPSATTGAHFWIQYGGAQSTFQSTATSVWNSHYLYRGHLEESANAVAGNYKDSTSNANNSSNTTNQPVQATGASCMVGNCQTINAANRYIDLTNVINASATGLTVKAWVNWADIESTSGNYQYFLSAAGAGGGGFVMQVYNNDHAQFTTASGSAVSSVNGVNGTWYQVVGTFDNCAGCGYSRKVYVNGTMDQLYPWNDYVTTDRVFRIGTSTPADNTAYYLRGTVDEVAVLNYPMTQAEIDVERLNLTTAWMTAGAEQ